MAPPLIVFPVLHFVITDTHRNMGVCAVINGKQPGISIVTRQIRGRAYKCHQYTGARRHIALLCYGHVTVLSQSKETVMSVM